ncbi:MAG: hydroxymethylbilane synthase [Deltaproteobacteria bacterium]|nr:hydroxymethylbilane synthase [Deltaproteobacteria bacterium]
MSKKEITIGTRGSRLALWQANHIKSALSEKDPSVSIKIKIVKTKGDKILDVPLAAVGGKGLFVKEIEEALLDGRIDIAVHSMKDMPAEIPEGLCIGCVPEREDPGDVLISKNDVPFSRLNRKARIGTSSLRRAAQLRHARPDIAIVSLRGNIDTRIKKLDTEKLDAVILAYAGVRRMNYESRVSERFDYSVMLPAVGQGALCIEIRENDSLIKPLAAMLDHEETHSVVKGERAFLHRLEGSCQVPVAAVGKIVKNIFTIEGLVADLEGKTIIRDSCSGPADDPEKTGVVLAEKLLDMGAGDILKNLTTGERKSNER